MRSNSIILVVLVLLGTGLAPRLIAAPNPATKVATTFQLAAPYLEPADVVVELQTWARDASSKHMDLSFATTLAVSRPAHSPVASSELVYLISSISPHGDMQFSVSSARYCQARQSLRRKAEHKGEITGLPGMAVRAIEAMPRCLALATSQTLAKRVKEGIESIEKTHYLKEVSELRAEVYRLRKELEAVKNAIR
jgi:hypothetical protein